MLEIGDHRNASALAQKNRGLAEALLDRAPSRLEGAGQWLGLIGRRVRPPRRHHQVGFTAVPLPHPHTHPRRTTLLDRPHHLTHDFLRILIRHQTAGHLRKGLARDDRFPSRALIPAPDSIELERRTEAHRLQRIQTVRRIKRGHVQHRAIALDRFGIALQLVPLPVEDRHHVVVETGHIHAAVGVVQTRTQLHQRLQGIVDRAPVDARMQVALGSAQFDFQFHQSAQGGGDHDLLRVRAAGVRYQHEVGPTEPLAIYVEKLLHARAADLLLPLDHIGQVQRQLRMRLQHPGQRRHVHDRRPLVVGRTAPVEASLAHLRLEGRTRPQVEGVGRLHVVMPVDHHMRPVRIAVPLGQQDRVQLRLHHLHIETQLFEQAARILPGLFHSLRIGGVRGNGGETNVIFQCFECVDHGK